MLPCDFTGKATVLAEDVPLFRGTFGVSRGQQAVQVEEQRPQAKHQPPSTRAAAPNPRN